MHLSEKIGQNSTIASLPEGTVLHECYRIEETIHADSCGVSYLVRHTETDVRYRIRECFPQQLAVRSGLALQAEDGAAFALAKRRFCEVAELCRNLPHISEIAEVFEENDTAYCVTAYRMLKSLADTDVPMTPAYVRSLGIALCDTYAAMKDGPVCGMLTKEDILFDAQGCLFLNIERIFEASADANADAASDLHALLSFLSACLAEGEDFEEKSAYPSRSILQEVLQHSYADALLLKEALICEDDGAKKPRTAYPQRRPLLLAAVCVMFLGIGICLVHYIFQSRFSLQNALQLGMLSPDVITVWAPLESGADEEAAIAAYERLTMGFEEKYPGYGVNITLYAENSFAEALEFRSADPPVVFMDTQDPIVLDMAADLTPLLRSLHEEAYLTDVMQSGNCIPLGFSLPVLYENTYRTAASDGETIAYEEIAPPIVFDASAADLVFHMDDGRKQSEFSYFLENGDQPILAGTDCLVTVRRSAVSIGAVRMLPVSVNGSYPMQYEMYCSVNRNVDTNSQRIGMLWLQYLLTEEAQETLYAERTGMFPVHSAAFEEVVSRDSELAVFGELAQQFDSTLLQ